MLEIDRDSEYARLEQEREIEVRRAVQRAELASERALRDQESEQAQIAGRTSRSRRRVMAQERSLAETRIQHEEDHAAPRDRPPARPGGRRAGASRELTEREQIALELAAGEGADRSEQREQQRAGGGSAWRRWR